MRVHVLQHVPFEGLGSIDSWLRARRAEVTCSRLYESPALPNIADFDMLIVLGGPMSVNEKDKYPWLVAEQQLIQGNIWVGKPTLGICLGAQLMAAALEARVYKNRQREIGWFPVTRVAGAPICFRMPKSVEVFHWHGETFDLPCGCARLAQSAACANQAFQCGYRSIGLQFHLETTPDSLAALIENCRDEIKSGRYAQSEKEMSAKPAEHFLANNALMGRLLDYLVRHFNQEE
ncbi:MAG: amidotransferase [Desulfobulbaceae bacterium]|jgi:GMP synthase-like glutamine amidotransferase|nr:amidotransferase [Desulfobulbaceae bacterium]